MKIWCKFNNIQVFFLHEDDFWIMIILAAMAFWMSDFDDFDDGQISWKLAQSWPFVFAFYGKIFFFFGNQDGSKITK